MNVCIFGNVGVGKTTVVGQMERMFPELTFCEISDLKLDPFTARAKLEKLRTYATVIVITTEGGRLQSDDVELFELFKSRKCLVVVNKLDGLVVPCALSDKIRACFDSEVHIITLSYCISHCKDVHSSLIHQSHQDFRWPYEKRLELELQVAEQKKQQDIELQKVELEKQRLVNEKALLDKQLAAAAKQLHDQQQAQQAAIAQAYARQAAMQRENQAREQARRQAEFAAQRQQEAQRQRQRDEQFRNQIARAGR